MATVLLLLTFLGQGVWHDDWTGGPGYPGPDAPDNTFYEETNVEWTESPGYLTLESPTDRYTVTDDIIGTDAAISAADVNGDGFDDIFYGTSVPGELGWHENLGGGTAWTCHTISSQPMSHIDSGDPDGDGDPDLLVASMNDDVLAWYENDGGTWTRHDLTPVQDMPLRLFQADIDQNGYMDLVSFSDDQTVSWYENDDGTGTSWTHHLIWNFGAGAGISWAESAQLDSDSEPEILVSLHDDGDIYYLDYETVNRAWNLETIETTGGWEWNCVDGACVNGDSDMDVIAIRTAPTGYYIHWWENGSWTRHTLHQGMWGDADYIQAMDLDDDNRADVAATGIGGAYGDIMTWLEAGMTGDEWYMRKGLEDCHGPAQCVTSGDFDDDGIDDLAGVCCSGDSGSIRWCDFHVNDYPMQGSLTTSICMVPMGTDYYEVIWGNLTWGSFENAWTDVGFQVRASADYNNMGPWSDTIWTQDVWLDSLLPEDGIYVQCKAILRTTESSFTPVIDWFSPEGYVPGGNPEGIPPQSLTLDMTNPSGERPVFHIGLPQQASARLTIYDIAGRIVQEEELGYLSAGTADYRSARLMPGVYFARLSAGNDSVCRRFMVVSGN